MDNKPSGEESANIEKLSSLADNMSESYLGFDANLHAVDEFGKPKYTKDGSYAKKRGRKAGAHGAQPASDSILAPASEVGISADLAAAHTANLIFNCAIMIGGEEEWQPSKEEAQGMKKAFKDYYDLKGVPNVPPLAGIILAVGMYALPRLNKPTTRDKIGQAWYWIKSKIGK